MRKIFFFMTFMLVGMATRAQIMNKGNYQYADETQLWRQTDNAAALSFDPERCDSSANRGVAYFNYKHHSGDYHRVQEGNQTNQLRFFTERYQKIGKYLYGYGSFDFDMGRTKNRAWSDVMRTYNANPYISGSDIPGKYDFQDFKLQARISTIQLGHFTYGATLSYNVGDLSRLRDPRSRINLAEYRIAPAATLSLGKHTLGLTTYYDRRKEKLPDITTVQDDYNVNYYLMSGLENAEGTLAGYKGYMREYVDHKFGTEVGYGLQSRRLKSVNTLSFATATEYVYGTNKYEPGKYNHMFYGLSSRNRIYAGNLLHSIDVVAGYEVGSADEYKEERTSTKDAETGETTVTWNKVLEYKKRYQMKKLDTEMRYRLSWTKDKAVYAYIDAKYDLQSVRNKRILHTSQLKYVTSLFGIEGGYELLHRSLWIEGGLNWKVNHNSSLDLNNPDTEYAKNVLIPDMEYYRANYFQGCLSVTYQFPLTIMKNKTMWYVRANGDWLRTNSNLHASSFGVTLGMFN